MSCLRGRAEDRREKAPCKGGNNEAMVKAWLVRGSRWQCGNTARGGAACTWPVPDDLASHWGLP